MSDSNQLGAQDDLQPRDDEAANLQGGDGLRAVDSKNRAVADRVAATAAVKADQVVKVSAAERIKRIADGPAAAERPSIAKR